MIENIEWDSNFFGRKIGRLTIVPPGDMLKKHILHACRDGYEYLTCRLVVEKISEIQCLEKHGFYITDIGAVWERGTDSIPEQTVLARQATVKDAFVLESMSADLFRDSRFYNDPFFTHEEAGELYREWIRNSLRDRRSRTFFIEGYGFIICNKINKKGDIVLIGVTPEKQGKGIGRCLVYQALNWFKGKKVDTVTVRTQANNIQAINFYMGLGFRMKHVDITMGLMLSPTLNMKMSFRQ